MEKRHRPRLVVADDHTLVAEACRALLEPEFEVLRIVDNGRSLVQAAGELKPDVLIVDIGMPQLNGLDAGEQIKRMLPAVKIIYLTMQAEADLAAEAFRRGASGYVLKSSAADELLLAIRRVLHGESYLSPLITKDTVEFLLRSGSVRSAEPKITPRQREVLQLLAEGKTMKEIAQVLDLQPGTVAFHKYRIMETLGVHTNAELLRFAIKQHMVRG
jgi:DNA-binding NarL/FixJ family response regulator